MNFEPLSDEEFDEVAREALDEIPELFAKYMKEVAVVVNTGNENRNLLGVYDPRGGIRRIVIFKDTIERVGTTRDGIRDEIRRTVLHEVGHHFGMSERKLRELGYG